MNVVRALVLAGCFAVVVLASAGDLCSEYPCDENAAGCLVLPNLTGKLGRLCLGCRYGFDGDGETCLEIDGCLVNPCDPNSLGCTDVPSSDLKKGNAGSEAGSASSGDPGSAGSAGSGLEPETTSKPLPADARVCLPCREGFHGNGIVCEADATSTEPGTTAPGTTEPNTASSSEPLTGTIQDTTDSLTFSTSVSIAPTTILVTTASSSSSSTEDIVTTTVANPTWGEWSSFGECSAQCGVGYKSRSRNCVGGKTCSGSSLETVQCSLESCYSTVLTYSEMDFDGTFGNPVDSVKLSHFISTFSASLTQTGFQVSKLESIKVTKSYRKARSTASGVDVTLTYAPSVLDEVKAATATTVPVTVGGQTFVGTPTHSANSGSSSSSSSKSDNTATIVGAVIGSAAVVALVALVVVVVKNRRKESIGAETMADSKVDQSSSLQDVDYDEEFTLQSASPSQSNRKTRTLTIHNPAMDYHV